MPVNNHIIAAAEEYMTNFYRDHVSGEYVYHDLQHVREVVMACREIGLTYELRDNDLEKLILAAWFHDSGFDKGPDNHETRSCENVARFLSSYDYPPDQLRQIEACIMATKMPQSPDGILEQILCDADLSHLGDKTYWDRCSKVRQELIFTRNKVMTDHEWVDFELNFLLSHHYHTPVARELFNKRKLKHISQLKKQKMRLSPDKALGMDDIIKADKSERNKARDKQGDVVLSEKQQQEDLGKFPSRTSRGVETMYRTTYQTHINLSSMADNKANIMLSINAIIISVIVSTLVPSLREHPELATPTIILLCVCLGGIVFATLSTRPKITQGKVTKEAIKERRANLLFFGNYHSMSLEDYQWGMNELIKDAEFQYSSMTRDLYFLGIVLAKKYRYLSICYGIFMYGLIGSVIAFALAFAWAK